MVQAMKGRATYTTFGWMRYASRRSRVEATRRYFKNSAKGELHSKHREPSLKYMENKPQDTDETIRNYTSGRGWV